MAHLQTYVEQEKELPVYEERKQHVLERIESMEKEMEKLTDRKFILSSQLTGMDTMIEKMKETFSVDMVEETGRRIRSNKETLGELQIQKGVLLERLENIDTMRGEISMLNNGIAVAAGRADCYEALKQAFSQDGVPHQIIRNIIPHITDTTNNILGQMTGGTMGVEFVMERTVKGKDGDKATLDALINEYGKTTLPYASKSGGEKVKASLAVILALSEIKATAAGIQLGMLFIDEPPFLDDEGAQAYVDALETIRDRYSDVKIMAITHDDAMKARFGQAVTVIKTDDYIVISATHDVDKMLMTLGLKKAPAAKKSSGNKKTKAKSYDVGDIVNFHGGKHYVSSYPDARGYSVGAGKAKITIKGGSGKAHPWHLVTQNWNQTHVWGWVDDGSFD